MLFHGEDLWRSIKKNVILIIMRRGNVITHYIWSHAKSCKKAKKVEQMKATDSSTPLTLWKKKGNKTLNFVNLLYTVKTCDNFKGGKNHLNSYDGNIYIYIYIYI